MAPFKSTDGRNLGKLLRGYLTNNIGGTLRSGVSGKFTVTGGTKFSSGDYTYHVFTSPGSLTLENGDSITFTDTLLVAGGGGGGGGYYGGGGGAGGVVHVQAWQVESPEYGGSNVIQFTVEVGDKGDGGPATDNSGSGTDGTNSSISYVPGTPSEKTWTAIGGGGGGGRGQTARQGGSGGGTGLPKSTNYESTGNPTVYGTQPDQTYTGFPGTSGSVQETYTFTHYGNPGGYPSYGSGGGGSNSDSNFGAGVPGPTVIGSNPKGPNINRGGGDAQAFPAFPAPVLSPYVPEIPGPRWTDVGPTGLYAAGGGGGAYPAPGQAYAGGNGGGGDGGNGSGNGQAAGGIGCGGGGAYPDPGVGADGSPGIVILRYVAS